MGVHKKETLKNFCLSSRHRRTSPMMKADEVDKLLTVLSRLLPKPVGRAKARRAGAVAGACTFVASVVVLQLALSPRTTVARLGLLVGVLALATAVRTSVMDYVFMVDNWVANAQHMVLVHKWIPEYCRVLRACFRS